MVKLYDIILLEWDYNEIFLIIKGILLSTYISISTPSGQENTLRDGSTPSNFRRKFHWLPPDDLKFNENVHKKTKHLL